MRISEGDDNSLHIEGPLSFRGFADAGCHHEYESISITKAALLPAKFARGLTPYRKVKKLWLWCDVSRTAMPHILALPEIEVVYILRISRPGRRMIDFSPATRLRQFRCNMGLKESDLISISRAPALEELGVQGSHMTSRSLTALLGMTSLTAVDFEDAGVTDDFAAQIAESSRLQKLELGSNSISDVGLKNICNMCQLKGLDIWQTAVSRAGLENLAKLTNLEYLALGRYCDNEPQFSGEQIIPVLDSIPSLKCVWLDGVLLTAEQSEMLNSRYEFFRN